MLTRPKGRVPVTSAPASRSATLSPPATTASSSPHLLDAVDDVKMVPRSFGFIDLCAFTAYTDRRGPHAAGSALTNFRSMVRDLADRRGVRVAKWMGDGVMIVGVEPMATVAMVVDAVGRIDDPELRACAGVTTGHALLFDGGDYTGRVVNLAARLCDMAAPGEVLAEGETLHHVPAWIDVSAYRTVSVRGLGRLDTVRRLTAPASAFTTSVRLTEE